MVEDKGFQAAIRRRIEGRRVPAERAVEEEFNAAANRLAKSRDLYLRARAEDLRDICQSIRKILLLGETAFEPKDPLSRKPVYISPHLHPSAVLRARKYGAAAFVTSSTANTSHGSILLRASGIPALGGIDITDPRFREGVPILVDAIRNEIYIDPSDEIREAAERLATQVEEVSVHHPHPPLAARCADGKQVHLFANVDHPSQTVLCFLHRMSGIGLFRSEFLILDTGRVPSEQEQHEIYRDVLRRLAGRPLVIRTFDIGADKVAEGLDHYTDANPALGVRGLRRHLLRFPGELRTQFRAILRAGHGYPVSILLPMVTNVEDVRRALDHLEAVRTELSQDGIPFNRNVRVGVMIEVPAAALNVGSLLEQVDFVSIGTNDLFQYLTASDRDNPDVLGYQDVESSGFRTLLTHIMNVARTMGRERDISVCGELASDPEGARFLAGMGVTTLSISAGSAPVVRQALREA